MCLCAHSYLTLCDPWIVACQASLSMGFPRQEYWSGLPFPSPGDLPDPGTELASPALKVDSLPAESLESQMISTELVQSRVPRLQAEGDMRMFSRWETWRQGGKQKGHRPVSRAPRCCPSWSHWSQSSGFHAFLSLLNDPSSGFPRHWIPPYPSKKINNQLKIEWFLASVEYSLFLENTQCDLSFSGSLARHLNMWKHSFGAHSLEEQQWCGETCILQPLHTRLLLYSPLCGCICVTEKLKIPAKMAIQTDVISPAWRAAHHA